MKRSALILTFLLIISVSIFAADASIGSSTATLSMTSSVPAGTGVELRKV